MPLVRPLWAALLDLAAKRWTAAAAGVRSPVESRSVRTATACWPRADRGARWPRCPVRRERTRSRVTRIRFGRCSSGTRSAAAPICGARWGGNSPGCRADPRRGRRRSGFCGGQHGFGAGGAGPDALAPQGRPRARCGHHGPAGPDRRASAARGRRAGACRARAVPRAEPYRTRPGSPVRSARRTCRGRCGPAVRLLPPASRPPEWSSSTTSAPAAPVSPRRPARCGRPACRSWARPRSPPRGCVPDRSGVGIPRSLIL